MALTSGDPRLAPGYVHAVHPDHGEPVVYTPGELLPGWLLDQLASGALLALQPEPGHFQLVPAPKPAAKGKR